jgi:alkylhydroperoxidase family enzyme
MYSVKSAKSRLIVIAVSVFLCLLTFQKAAADSARLTEPRLSPLQEPEWNDAQKEVLTPLKAYFSNGRVINVFTTVARNPNVLRSWISFAGYIASRSTLPARERELLMLRIGWLCKSEYEFGQHTLIGKRAGLTDEEILRITKGQDAPGWSDFDATLLRAVDELHRDAFITDATWKALSKQYNEQQLIDVVMTVGQYNLVSMTLNTLGVQLDPGVPGFPEGSKK